jgi:hypothetical protein
MKLFSRLSAWSAHGVRGNGGSPVRDDDEDLWRWLDERVRWLIDLPWVVERPAFREHPRLRCFAIDCEPLARRRVWALVGPLTMHTELSSSVHVVVPN